MEIAKGSGGGGGGEVRRVHIIYFLSCMGRVEQPHLIRVHHLARNGVYLRDVKRWLVELRGKDLPEAFAWSYKRRYKTGYVWQDLLDDDLITPISDNEYVLKGSQIHPTPFETCLLGEKKASIIAEEIPLRAQVAEGKEQKLPSLMEEPQIQRYPDFKTNAHEILSSEISSDRSTLTDEYESSKVEEDKLVGTGKQNPDEQSPQKYENYSLHYSLYHSLMNKKSRNPSKKDNMNKNETPDTSFSTSSYSISSSQASTEESKSYSTGASGVFRNLITCGGLDTDDTFLVMMNRGDKNVSKNSNDKADIKAEIRKEDKLGGSARIFRSFWNLQPQQQQCPVRISCDEKITNKNRKKLGDLLNQSPHKPFDGPICS